MLRYLACSLLGLGVTAASAQSSAPDPTPQPFSITRSDPALDALIAPDAKLTTVASGFGRGREVRSSHVISRPDGGEGGEAAKVIEQAVSNRRDMIVRIMPSS